MENNNNLEKIGVSSVDRPSFHWHKKYLDKVNRIVETNINNNASTNFTIYKKFPKIFKFSWLYFLPFFIGYLISVFSIFVSYGRIKSSTVFNKEMYKYFWKKAAIISFIYFIFGPLLILTLFIFFPLLGGISFNVFQTAWSNLIASFSQQGLNEGFHQFIAQLVVPTFNSNAWWISFIAIGAISMLNISAIIGYFIINKINDKTITLYVLEDSLKMKISRFTNSKTKKILRKKIVNVEIPNSQIAGDTIVVPNNKVENVTIPEITINTTNNPDSSQQV